MANDKITSPEATDGTSDEAATKAKAKSGKNVGQGAQGAAKTPKPAKPAKTTAPVAASAPANASPAAAAITITKSATVLKLLRRKKGAAISEIGEATGWQAHSVRGFISAVVKKRMGLEVKSEAGSDGVRRYTVQS